MKRTVIAAAAMLLLFCHESQARHHPGGFYERDSSLLVRLGYFVPSGDSVLWEQNTDLLTYRTADFNDFMGGVAMKLAANENLNITFGFDYYRHKEATQYRDFTDEEGLPIMQDIKLTVVPITVTAEFLPFGRSVGRQRGRGHEPLKVLPYVGAGLGLYVYQYEEIGDQIDFRDYSIYSAHLISEGQEPGVHITGGLDVPLSRNAMFSMEGRYHWVHAPLSSDFVGYDDFDLSGAQFTFGFGYRF